MDEVPATRATIQTSDCAELGEWARTVGRWDVEYQQVGRGPLSAPLALSFYGRVMLSDQSFNRSVICQGAPPQRAIAVILPSRHNARNGIYKGQEVEACDAVAMRSPSEGFLRTPEAFRFHTITIPEGLLGEMLESYARVELASVLSGSKVLRLSPERLSRLHGLLASRTDPAFAVPGSETGLEVEQEVLQLVAESLMGPSLENQKSDAPRKRAEYVREARARIDEGLSGDVILSEVAGSLGICLRTLETAFLEVLGMRPVEYVRNRRLHRVREQLLRREGAEGGLGKVAWEFGLRHQGYFSRDYRRLFGELPSETVRRRGR